MTTHAFNMPWLENKFSLRVLVRLFWDPNLHLIRRTGDVTKHEASAKLANKSGRCILPAKRVSGRPADQMAKLASVALCPDGDSG